MNLVQHYATTILKKSYFNFLQIDHPKWPPSAITKYSDRYETDKILNYQIDFQTDVFIEFLR